MRARACTIYDVVVGWWDGGVGVCCSECNFMGGYKGSSWVLWIGQFPRREIIGGRKGIE